MKNWNCKTILDMKHWNSDHRACAASLVFTLIVGVAAASPKTLMASSDYGVHLATSSDAEAVTEEITMTSTEAVAPAETESLVKVEKDSAVRLNTAYVYPEGTDQSDVWNSYAGSLYKDLTSKDATWLSDLYNLASVTPVSMASRLGNGRNTVIGKYRSDVEEHKEEDASSWIIPKFEKTTFTFVDGNGKTITACSNAKEILTMASIYTYYNEDSQGALMVEYAGALWEQSHSSNISMGKVYYCNGSLDHPLDESEEPEEAVVYADVDIPDAAQTAAKAIAATIDMIIKADAATAAPTETASPSDAVITESYPKEIEQVLEGVDGPGRSIMASEAMRASETSPETSVETSPETEVATAAEIATETETETEKETEAEKKDKIKGCTGHIDLQVTAVIAGFSGDKGLYAKDSMGNAELNHSWQGWEEYNRAYVTYLYGLDWVDSYGLAASDIAVINPLSPSEIAYHMKNLPADLSQTRRDVVAFALSSVGRVPYYWGGKPAASNYEANSFGTLVSPDRKGRVLRGLDCSGWINWVYWTVTGNRLPAEGTGSLSTYANGIGKNDMQPGDIMVTISANSHVVMFLGWDADGTMKCIHESSAGSGNVTISSMSANGTTYRSLVSP